MGKRFKHMGMEITEAEHEKWHKEHSALTEKEHRALMKKMGINKEEDKKWHEKNDMPLSGHKKAGRKAVNPFAIGGGFLHYCIEQGWLIQEGKARCAKYYITNEGQKELKKFGIRI